LTHIPISIVGDVASPSEIPVHGNQRLVRMLPCGLPGTKGKLFPCLWISPYAFLDEDLKVQAKICLLLITKGPPRPDVIAITLPADAIEKFPLAPVEW